MEIDRRMFFVRNKEFLEKEDEYDLVEYEVTTDSHVVGNLNYGCYELLIWELSNKLHGEEKKLCFRLQEGKFTNWREATPSSYYHGGDIIDELTSLVSIYFRKRFNSGPIVRVNDKPRYYPKGSPDIFHGGWIDKKLISYRANLGDLTEWFENVERLKPEYHQRFIWAARLYNRAISIIEKEPDIAYLNLISAIEALCQDTEIEKSIDDLNDQKLIRLLQSIEKDDLKEEIVKRLLKKERMIKKKFVQFILDHVIPEFWEHNDEDRSIRRVKPEELQNLLGKIYDQRSNTLHNGEPFPNWLFSPPTEEILGAIDVTSGGRKWEENDFIPYPCFFEGLVNHVLKNFVVFNQEQLVK